MTSSGPGPHDEPVDIFERQEFPADPPAATRPAEPTASDLLDDPLEPPARKRVPLWVFALVGVAVGLVIAWVGLNQGGGRQPQVPADHPPTDAPIATPTPLTAEEMAQLKAKVDAEPTNKDHRLVYGVALYNAGTYDLAEEQFLAATELDAADPAPWYNLGFLYLSTDPPAADKAEQAWRKVVELAPGTSMADTVSQHIDRLNTTPVSPGASPASSPLPSPVTTVTANR